MNELKIPQLMADHVKIKCKDSLDRKIHKMVKDGKEKLQIITDFDFTLSKSRHNGEKTHNSFFVFEAIPNLPASFLEGHSKLLKDTLDIESNWKLTVEEKIPLMEECWKKFDELYVGLPCSQSLIDQAISDCVVHLRTGSEMAFRRLHEAKVPTLVLSAGSGNIVQAILKKHGILFDNVHVMSNFFEVENGKVSSFKAPIHLYNKNLQAIKTSCCNKELAHRPNIILMGDSLGDANMNEGVKDQGEVLKIGFLNGHVDGHLPQFLESFDIVLIDDQTMDVFNVLLDQIL